MIVPRPPTGRESLAALAIGAELRRAVATQYGVGTVLCWPNDLLVPGHRSPPGKLAGILLDQVFSIEHGAALVAGIGLNVRPDRSQFPPGLRERVATLAELSPPGPTVRDAEELAASAAMSGIARLQTSDGARGVIDECRQALYGRGRRASVDGMPAGRIRELGDDGTLWLDGVAGAVPVRAGSLSIEEPS
jgi:biotin-(acetyl-CoA carboxylase) ligase